MGAKSPIFYLSTWLFCYNHPVKENNMAEKKTGFMAEFKKFIMRGNVLDMAVGMVVGAAFTAIVQSVVKDIINPVVGLLIGSIDFQELRIILKPATDAAGEVAIRYGALIQNIIQFLITAFILFVIIRATNRLKDKRDAEAKAKAEAESKAKAAEEAAKPAPVPEDIALLREIRDALKKN